MQQDKRKPVIAFTPAQQPDPNFPAINHEAAGR
jgi:hypothetical protein